MSIGTIIKQLRRDRDMTQEQLADLLGLTPAAISGWECDRNAPDLSQIPQLSHIFGVSADILLGIDLSRQDERIEAIQVKAAALSGKEAVECYRQGLAEMPSAWRLMLSLADVLDYPGDEPSLAARKKERIALYERIRENCTDPWIKNCAEGRLCGIYLHQGKRDLALKIAEGIPNLMYSYRDIAWMLAEGMDKIYELHYIIKGDFASLCDNIYCFSRQQIDGKPFFDRQQAITLLEKLPKLLEIFYENGDYLDDSWIGAWAHTRLAEHYAELNDRKKTLEHLSRAAAFARMMDDYPRGLQSGPYGYTDVWGYPLLPAEKRHTSLLGDPALDYPTTTVWQNNDESESYTDKLKKEISHSRFDFIRSEMDAIW